MRDINSSSSSGVGVDGCDGGAGYVTIKIIKSKKNWIWRIEGGGFTTTTAAVVFFFSDLSRSLSFIIVSLFLFTKKCPERERERLKAGDHLHPKRSPAAFFQLTSLAKKRNPSTRGKKV